MTLPTVSFTGLATPFDASALIDQLMDAERIPLLQLQSKRSGYEAKDAAWQQITTRVSALRSALDDVDLGTSFSVTSSNDTAVGVTVTGTPSPGVMEFSVDRLAKARQRTLKDSWDFTSPDDLTGSGTFTITVDGTDYDISLDGSSTYQDLTDLINASGAGVTATMIKTDANEYNILLAADTPGDDSDFTVNSTNNSLKSNRWRSLQAGDDARISIGSLTIERSSNTITDLVPGVAIELKATTSGDVAVTVDRDLANAGDKIQALVDELNKVIDEIDAATRYDVDAGSGGVLVGDTAARSLVSALRSAVSGAVGGTSGDLVAPAVGISITRNGRFELDRAAFDEAYASDPDNVQAFFDDTLLADLDTALDAAEGANGSIQRARDRWTREIDYVDDRIADWEDRLDQKEAALVRQFAQLDAALGQLDAMSSWLTAQIGSLNANSS